MVLHIPVSNIRGGFGKSEWVHVAAALAEADKHLAHRPRTAAGTGSARSSRTTRRAA